MTQEPLTPPIERGSFRLGSPVVSHVSVHDESSRLILSLLPPWIRTLEELKRKAKESPESYALD